MRLRKKVGQCAVIGSMFATFFADRPPEPDKVRIDSGVVMGTTTGTPGVRVFRGIPFAAQPVGELRWKAPRPVRSWGGAWNACDSGRAIFPGGEG